MIRKLLLVVIAVSSLFFSSGCAIMQRAKEADKLEQQVTYLRNKLDALEKEKEEEISELELAQEELARSLQKEIGDYKAKLEMTERGLVITFLAEIFFDSGKVEIRESGKEALRKVAVILKKDVPDSFVAIEGHTDNEPIRYSGWDSNWELSSGRALSVLHFLIEDAGIAPERLSANAYSEYRPITSNATQQGKQQNRRVEIVILPSKVSKVKAENP